MPKHAPLHSVTLRVLFSHQEENSPARSSRSADTDPWSRQAWVGLSKLGGNSTATAPEIAASAEQNKQALLEGMPPATAFVFQSREIQEGPRGSSNRVDHIPRPQKLSTWFLADEQGQRVAMASTVRDLEGTLLGYVELHDDGTVTHTDLVAGMIHPLPPQCLV